MWHSLALTILLCRAVLAQDPGLPVKNPTISYWQIPPNQNVADLQSSELPESVDVVIIGSGMTGTSVARNLLKESPKLRVAMVEARQACSGATGRNGGQITTASFAQYEGAKAILGKEEAAKFSRLQALHANAMVEAASELSPTGRDAAQVRRTECVLSVDDNATFTSTLQQYKTLQEEVPDLAKEFIILQGEEARNYTLFPSSVGALVISPNISGALWPYRFVTHMLKETLDAYPSFSLDAHTAVLNVTLSSNSSSKTPVYSVVTERGTILARHVVHAENAWIPHLVPGLQGKLQGGRLAMSAQLGGAGLPKPREWPRVFNIPSDTRTFNMGSGDYAVQNPITGEFMMGGGGGGGDCASGGNTTAPDPSRPSDYDDSVQVDHSTATYFHGALPNFFSPETWGAERTDFPEPPLPNVWPGRTKRIWTGIEAFSPDGRPLVGRIPSSITARPVASGAAGAEWISTGYDGEGMVFAWLCGKAISGAILGFENSPSPNGTDTYPNWLPQSMLITEARLASPPSAGAKRMTRLVRSMTA